MDVQFDCASSARLGSRWRAVLEGSVRRRTAHAHSHLRRRRGQLHYAPILRPSFRARPPAAWWWFYASEGGGTSWWQLVAAGQSAATATQRRSIVVGDCPVVAVDCGADIAVAALAVAGMSPPATMATTTRMLALAVAGMTTMVAAARRSCRVRPACIRQHSPA